MPAMGGAAAFIAGIAAGFILPIPIAIGGAGAGIPAMGAAATGAAVFANKAWSWVAFACSSASCWVSAGASGGMVPAAT